MLYPRCPTCGENLAEKEIPYNTQMKEIENNPKLDVEAKKKAKQKLLNSLGVPRYCCRMRIMGFINLAEKMV